MREEVRLIYDRVEPPSRSAFWREHLLPYLSMNYGRMPVGNARTLLPAEAAGD